MRVDPKATIAQLPVLRVRDALRALAFQGSFLLRTLACELKTSEEQARLVTEELVGQGYAEPAADDRSAYRLTAKGRQFMLASGRPGLTREAATRKLREFMERVGVINRNPDFVFRVTEVCVFGSFLSDAPTLSDIDIAITLETRYAGKEHEKRFHARIEAAENAGRRFGNMLDRLGWPRNEILRELKARNAAISLHEVYELRQLGCPYKRLFPQNEIQ